MEDPTPNTFRDIWDWYLGLVGGPNTAGGLLEQHN